EVQSCVANWKTCDGSEGLYGEPPRAEERPVFLDKLKSLREQRLRANDDLLKRMLPATNLAIEYLLAVIRERGSANRGYTPSNLDGPSEPIPSTCRTRRAVISPITSRTLWSGVQVTGSLRITSTTARSNTARPCLASPQTMSRSSTMPATTAPSRTTSDPMPRS